MKHDLMAANVALHRKHWAINFVKTCRALGMTDDEIRAALTDTTAPAPHDHTTAPEPPETTSGANLERIEK